MPGHEYFTPREVAIRQIMRPLDRAKNVALAFVLSAYIPAGLRMYEGWTERQLVPTPIADFFFPRTAKADIRRFEDAEYRRQREIRWHSAGEAIAEAGILMGLGALLSYGIKKRAERRFNPKS